MSGYTIFFLKKQVALIVTYVMHNTYISAITVEFYDSVYLITRPQMTFDLGMTVHFFSFQEVGQVRQIMRFKWNSLPTNMRQAKSLDIFKGQLKTHLFNSCFCLNVLLVHVYYLFCSLFVFAYILVFCSAL